MGAVPSDLFLRHGHVKLLCLYGLYCSPFSNTTRVVLNSYARVCCFGCSFIHLVFLVRSLMRSPENTARKRRRLSVYTQLAPSRGNLGVKFSESSEISLKHLRRILPIHAIVSVPPVQGIRQALPEVAGVALQRGSE